ncbi:MAG: NAD(P)-dependent oxidoreductase [Minisyncoccia bacterium]|jgi:nucleoside-diphosphate-sugar epimerase
MAKILVTGGAGYIGSVLVPELLRAEHEVTVIDNFLYGQTPFLEVCHIKHFTIVRGDARDRELIAKHIVGKDYIIPLACLVGAPVCDRDPITARTTNVGAVELILKLRKPGQRIIFPNTNSGYGTGRGDTTFCTEETPLNPISLYGRLKVEAERKILEAGEAITFRLATVCGMSPRMRLDLLVNDFVYRAVNDRFIVLFEAHFKRNFIHVRDVARAFVHAIDNFEAMKNNAYNVGLSDANLSKWELCEEIKKHVPDFVCISSGVGKDVDQRNYIVSNAKIELTGFKPITPLADAIPELIKGFTIVKRNMYGNV